MGCRSTWRNQKAESLMDEIYQINPYEFMETFHQMQHYMMKSSIPLRLCVAVDEGGVKFKVNGGMWSPPIGKKVEK